MVDLHSGATCFPAKSPIALQPDLTVAAQQLLAQ
jgi:hypothetical protein